MSVLARVFASVLLVLLSCLAVPSFAAPNFPGTTLTGTSGTVTDTTVGAGPGETNENATFGGGSLDTQWYSWTAPSNGVFTANICNVVAGETTFDPVMKVYTGNAFPLPTTVSQNDDGSGCNVQPNNNWGSVVSFNAISGTTYRIQVDGYASGTGNFTMRWGFVGVIINVTDSSATEGGDTAAFTVSLVAPPAPAPPTNTGGNVIATIPNVVVTLGTSTQCTFSTSTLTFNSTTWTTPQTVTAAAVDDALVEGTHSCSPASVTATGGAYAGVTATPPTITINDNENPNFTISKSASAATITSPGTITYTITVDNNGSAILTGPSITDSLLLGASARTLTSGPTLTSGDTNSNGLLEDTETWIYAATYNATQTDIDTGGTFSNTATFSTTQVAAKTSNAATTAITQTPNLTVTKTQSGGSNPVTSAGQSINYQVSVANTGNVTLTGLSISDALTLGAAARTLTSGPALASGDTNINGKLDVGETWVYNASYTATQADLDATGNFSNTATFSSAQAAATTSAVVATPVTRSPSLTNVKSQSAGPSPVTAAGQTLTYQIVIANTGNITLTSPVLTDTLLLGAAARTLTSGPTLSSGDINANSKIDVGETWTYTATYVTTQVDIDGTGAFTNKDTITTAQTATNTSNTVTTNITRTPQLTLLKSYSYVAPGDDANGNGLADKNDKVTYVFKVTNTGNMTMSNIVINETFLGQGVAPVPAGETLTTDAAPTGDSTDATTNNSTWSTLAPGDSVTFTGTYTVTQADVDAG